MPNISPVWTMISLDIFMIIYTLWVVSVFKPIGKLALLSVPYGHLAGCAAFWTFSPELFPQDISGIAFLTVIFAGTGLVDAATVYSARPSRPCGSCFI